MVISVEVPDDVLAEFEKDLSQDIERWSDEVKRHSEAYEEPLVEKAGDGVMVAYMLPSELAEELAIPDGEDAGGLHITLAYLGTADSLSEEKIRVLHKVVEECASSYAPLAGSVSGVAVFPASDSSDNKQVLVRLVDVPYLESLRQKLVENLQNAGIGVMRNHGYTPHITLQYAESVDVADVGFDSYPLVIDALTVVVAGERQVHPLDGHGVLKGTGPTQSSVHTDRPLTDSEEEDAEEEEEDLAFEFGKSNPCHNPSGPAGGQFCSGAAQLKGAKGRAFAFLKDGQWHQLQEVKEGVEAKAVRGMLRRLDDQGVALLNAGRDGWRVQRVGKLVRLRELTAEEARSADLVGRVRRPRLPKEDKPKSQTPQSQDKTALERHLETADIASVTNLGGGISVTQLVTFADGSKAVFKPASGERSGVRRNIPVGKAVEREVGAWQIARLGGVEDLVPPVVQRTIGGSRGSLAAFERGKEARDSTNPYDGDRDLSRAAIFDYVIGNTDRHQRNWLIREEDRKIRLIDHNLTFPNHDRGGFSNQKLWNEARQRFFGESIPSEFIQPYLTNRASILNSLRSLKLPEAAVDGVGARIDSLQVGMRFLRLV